MTAFGHNQRYDVAVRVVGDGFDAAFREALTFVAGIANPNTATAYRLDLFGCAYKPGECRHTEPEQHNTLAWLQWCRTSGIDPLRAGRDEIKEWLAALADSGMSGSTRARRLGAVSSWYASMFASEKIDANPVDRLRPKERPKQRTKGTAGTALDDQQALALLAAADVDGPRSAALVSVLIYGGVRVSEVVNLDVEDYRGKLLNVVVKGGDHMQVPAPPVVTERIDAWLAARPDSASGTVALRNKPGTRKRPMFITHTGGRMSRQTLYRIVRRLAVAAGVPTPVSPHDLRRTHISQAIDEGVPIRDVQRSVGHAQSTTTEGYDRSHLDPERHTSYRLARRHAELREDGQHAA